MSGGWRIAARAAVQVLLVSASSVTLAAYERHGGAATLGTATGVSFLISWIWVANVRDGALSGVPGARVWYAGGAAVGTLVGATAARVVVGWL